MQCNSFETHKFNLQAKAAKMCEVEKELEKGYKIWKEGRRHQNRSFGPYISHTSGVSRKIEVSIAKLNLLLVPVVGSKLLLQVVVARSKL